jgi:3-oxoisoapionate kinase
MSKLLLTFYGDDFTGSTDALEQLTSAGIRTALFIEPPTLKQLARFKNLQAVGVAGITRSLAPAAMERELRPALKKLKALGAPHVHYKVCSTFDSSPKIGSIGRVIDIGMELFKAPFVPLFVAAPALGRYTVFGTHFARFGIGSAGAIHRLDRHPSIGQHPVTPMTEADLRLHLAKQTKKRIDLFDILKLGLSLREAQAELKRILKSGAEAVLFDALYQEQLQRVGELIDSFGSGKHPLFSVGSSGIEMALAAFWKSEGRVPRVQIQVEEPKNGDSHNSSLRQNQILVGSGSCSLVTSQQIARALQNGFAEVALDASALNSDPTREIRRCVAAATAFIKAERSVIVHTTKRGANPRVAAKLKNRSASVLGCALGSVMWATLKRTQVKRLCIAGGDTSSFAARALGIEALEMISPLTPGAPLCRAFASDSPIDGREVVFKGGQVGGEDYFAIVRNGKA